MVKNNIERAVHGMGSLEYSGRMQAGGLSPRYAHAFEGGRTVTVIDVHGALNPDAMKRATLRPTDPTKSASKFSK